MKGVLIGLLLLLASPAAATQDGWPALYDVAGVASDDTLNVRNAPDAGSEIVGTITHDRAGIEVVLTNNTGTWGLVNIGEGSGWVSMRFMQRRPGQWAGNVPEIAQCFGTEPFWSFTNNQGVGQWSTPEESASFALSAGIPSQNRFDRFAFNGTKFDPTKDVLVEDQAFVFVAATECTDGMSDRRFGLTVDLYFNDLNDPGKSRLLSGCCTLAP